MYVLLTCMTCLLASLLTYLLTNLLIYLLTHLLTYLPTYSLTYFLAVWDVALKKVDHNSKGSKFLCLGRASRCLLRVPPFVTPY